MTELRTPLSVEDVKKLRVGDIVRISGMVCTVRDGAHERALKRGKFPVDIEGGVVFHAGPIVKGDDGWRIIAIGPTTSSRMNSLTPGFIDRFGIRAIIGKGGMDKEVVKSMRKNNLVYFSMTGGCASSTPRMIKEITGVYWLDLGVPEAVWVLEVERFGPLIVSIDTQGKSLYEGVGKTVEKRLKALLEDHWI
jgi:fumarate hydratase subunit beta